MNRVISLAVFLGLLISSSISLADVDLTPNDLNGSNEIPALNDNINFSTSNGNWLRDIALPNHTVDGVEIRIRSQAQFTSNLHAGNINTLFSLVLRRGDYMAFRFELRTGKWRVINMPVLNIPVRDLDGGAPDLASRYNRIVLQNGSHRDVIPLPSNAPDDAQLVIMSNSDQSSRIETDKLRYASSMALNKGDRYLLKYDENLAMWETIKTPRQRLSARDVAGGIPTPSYPVTEVWLTDGDWRTNLKLPSNANNRDKVVVRSRAGRIANILNDNVAFGGTMQLRRNDAYEFVFDTTVSAWNLFANPTRRYRANEIDAGAIPANTSPLTLVSTWNDGWFAKLNLPGRAKTGDRVRIKNSDSRSMYIVASNRDFEAPVTIRRGESRGFIYSANGLWQLETELVTILWLYSTAAKDRVGGEAAIRTRIYESFKLGQEALANSDANFTVKIAKLAEWNLPGGADSLGEVLSDMRSDPTVETIRNQVAADAIYYTGTEDGCGLAYVNGTNPFNMAGSESLNCGVSVFRHEFGHMMGLGHANTPGITPYAQGYGPARTVMGGNAIPYFSNITHLVPETLGEMGVIDAVDGVRAMNEVSARVANFR